MASKTTTAADVLTFAGFAEHSPGIWARGETVVTVNSAMGHLGVYNVGSGHASQVGMIRAKDEGDALAIAAMLDGMEYAVRDAVSAAGAALDACSNRGIASATFKPHLEEAIADRARTMLATLIRANFEG